MNKSKLFVYYILIINQINNFGMNLKAMLPVVIGTLIAMVVYQLVIKKMVEKESYEMEDFED